MKLVRASCTRCLNHQSLSAQICWKYFFRGSWQQERQRCLPCRCSYIHVNSWSHSENSVSFAALLWTCLEGRRKRSLTGQKQTQAASEASCTSRTRAIFWVNCSSQVTCFWCKPTQNRDPSLDKTMLGLTETNVETTGAASGVCRSLWFYWSISLH